MTLLKPGPGLGQTQQCDGIICSICIQYPVSLSLSIYCIYWLCAYLMKVIPGTSHAFLLHVSTS